MLADKASDECSRCYEMEQSGFRSLRIDHNESFKHHLEIVSETKEDGTVDRINMPYLDIRFSNICNFRCRTCGPELSSNWFDDAKASGRKPSKRILRPDDPEKLWGEIESFLPTVEKIYFAGGEPLMMEEHYRILKMLAAQGRFDVHLSYNTNMSQTAFKDLKVFELWNQFKYVVVGASLDGMGEKGEYIRKGMKWDQIVANRKEMMRVCPNVNFYVNFTLSVLNFLDMPAFHRTWVEEGLVEPSEWNINPLTYPEYFRPSVAPDNLREKAIELYEDHMDWLKSVGGNQMALSRWEGAITSLRQPHEPQWLGRLRYKLKQMDDLRGEDFATTFPELACLL
jgi:sulfatase maturation enzyme AslB (radical SAM superfamily)